MMQMDDEEFKISAGKKISLKDYDPDWVPKWAKKQEEKEGKKSVKQQALGILDDNRQKLIEMQELFWASEYICYADCSARHGCRWKRRHNTARNVGS